MTRHLPFVILLFVLCYLLFVTPSYAQEISPTIAFSPQIQPQAQGNVWENFKNMFIPDTLKNVNCAGLPLSACMEVKNANTTGNTTNSTVKTQANSSDNTNTVIEGAYQYDIRSGVSLPSDVGKSSTNINDVFGGIIDFLKNITQIFDQGSEKAQWSAEKDLPSNVGDQVIKKESAMNDSLPVSQCAGLPADLCSGNKPNIVQ